MFLLSLRTHESMETQFKNKYKYIENKQWTKSSILFFKEQLCLKNNLVLKTNLYTSLAVKGALANRLQRLQNTKWQPAGPKMANRV